MRITVCNSKGGVGKTTTTALLAAALHEASYTVSLQDADPQESLNGWVNNVAFPVCSSRDVPDITLIDTPPRIESRKLRRLTRDSYMVIFVTTSAPLDIQATAEAVAAIQPGDRARVLFNKVNNTNLNKNLPQLASEIGLPMLNSIVRQRVAYQYFTLQGWKALSPVARDEVLKLALEVIK